MSHFAWHYNASSVDVYMSQRLTTVHSSMRLQSVGRLQPGCCHTNGKLSELAQFHSSTCMLGWYSQFICYPTYILRFSREHEWEYSGFIKSVYICIYILIFDLPSVVTSLCNIYIQSSNSVQLEPAAVGKDHTGHQPMYFIYMQHQQIICHLDHESVALSQLAAWCTTRSLITIPPSSCLAAWNLTLQPQIALLGTISNAFLSSPASSFKGSTIKTQEKVIIPNLRGKTCDIDFLGTWYYSLQSKAGERTVKRRLYIRWVWLWPSPCSPWFKDPCLLWMNPISTTLWRSPSHKPSVCTKSRLH